MKETTQRGAGAYGGCFYRIPISRNLKTTRSWTFFGDTKGFSALNQKYRIACKCQTTCYRGYMYPFVLYKPFVVIRIEIFRY